VVHAHAIRRLQPLTIAIGALLVAAVAVGYVNPESGQILPYFELRAGGEVLDGTALTGAELAPRVAEPPYQPGPKQAAALARIKGIFGSRLTVEFHAENGMPRQLHAAGEPLTAASRADRVKIVRDYLQTHRAVFRLTPAEIDALVVVRDYETGGSFRTIWLGQDLYGIPVDRGHIRFVLDAQGRIRWISSGLLVPGLELVAVPQLSPEAAIRAAAGHIGVTLEQAPPRRSPLGSRRNEFEPGPFLSTVVVEPVIYSFGSSALLAWHVMLEPRNEVSVWYSVTVDANGGELLRRFNLYKYVRNEGLVFDGNYPSTAPNPPYINGVTQSIQSFGYRWPSTTGWTIPAPHANYRDSMGNNVETREDLEGDNEATLGAFAVGTAQQEWLFGFSDAYALSLGTTDDQRIADHLIDQNSVIVNLFYWNNLWHDYMHGLGFDEAAGNFQFDNFGRGGCGSDAVRADALDNANPSSGNRSLNNANFATPSEPLDCMGSFRPRMQQFVTRIGPEAAPTFLADTSLDADVIIHEYLHGVSNRLVGGPANGCLNTHQAGSMGEGWGDWYAASYFDDPVMGEFAFGNAATGIRQFAMDANPRTYADFMFEVHDDGEIHASILWDIRTVVGQAVIEQLATDAMKLSPCAPTFPDYRDALILADQIRFGGTHVCNIWDAYFARGIGFEADAIGGSTPVPDFQFNAPVCTGLAHLRYDSHTTIDADGDGLFRIGEQVDLLPVLENIDGATLATVIGATVTSLTPGITMVTSVSSYPDIAIGGTAAPVAPFQFVVDVGFVCGTPIDFQIDFNWAPALARTQTFRVTSGSQNGVLLFADGAEGTPLVVGGNVAVSSAQAHTGSQSYYTLDACFAGPDPGFGGPCSQSCNTITVPDVTLPGAQAAMLSFWATYNIQEGSDGLYVQVSNDAGQTWQYLDTIDYNGTIGGTGFGGCNTVTRPGINGPTGNGALVPWTQFRGSLAAFAGQTVQIQIVQHMNFFGEWEGAYIDDIELHAQDCQTAPFVDMHLASKVTVDDVDPSCSDADGEPDPGETIDVTVGLTHTGNTLASGTTGTLMTTHPGVTIVPATATQNYGDMNPGDTVARTFQYTVASTGIACFDAADFEVDVTANAGAYNETFPFGEILRQDPANSWFDDMEGTQPPWTPSLGPAGTAQDFALRELDCFAAATNQWFWATNLAMTPGSCNSNEPDYSDDSDSVLTSPAIDLVAAGARIDRLSWRGSHQAGGFGAFRFPPNFGGTADPGLVEVLIDHDFDGNFTLLASWPNGQNPVDRFFTIDVQNNPAGSPILAADTTQQVQVQIRFRALGADPGNSRASDGIIVDDVLLEWTPCDVNLCAPNLRMKPGRTVSGPDQRGTK